MGRRPGRWMGKWFAAAGMASGIAGQTTVEGFVDQLLPTVQRVGRKDSPQTLRPMRIGPILWHTGDARGGYHGAVSQLEHQVELGLPPALYAIAENSGESTPLQGGQSIVPDVYDVLFTAEHAEFSILDPDTGGIDPGGDFAELFGANPDINFFAAQNGVLSLGVPLRVATADGGAGAAVQVGGAAPSPEPGGPLQGPPGPDLGLTQSPTFPVLDGVLAPLAVAGGRAFVQDIGFANNFIFPTHRPDVGVRYPLVTKHDLDPDVVPYPAEWFPRPGGGAFQPQIFGIPWDIAFDGDPELTPSPPYLNVPASMADPTVAAWLRSHVRSRTAALDAWGPEALPYHLVGGEYRLGDEPLRDAVWAPLEWPCADVSAGVHCDGNCNNCAPCPLPNGPQQPTKLATFHHLPNTDYSAGSLRHFGQWLTRRYPEALGMSTIDQIELSWRLGVGGLPCKAVEDCALLDPLAALDAWGDRPETLRAVWRDWRDFQEDQYEASQTEQYRAAKQVGPRSPVHVLTFTGQGFEWDGLRADGVASGNWYTDNSERLAVVTPIKKRALHAVTLGESLNFPLFGMPKLVEDGGFSLCQEDRSAWDGVPVTFQPPCWDFDFSNRTLREMLCLGADSLAVGYWENLTLWTLNGGQFAAPGADAAVSGVDPTAQLGPSFWTLRGGYFGAPGAGTLIEVMASEVARWRQRRLFMTPWHSPLLVHVGSAVNPHLHGEIVRPYLERELRCGELRADGLTDHVVDGLGEQQVSWAPFSRMDVLDDLWAVRGRGLLLSPFVPDFVATDPPGNLERVQRYEAAVDDSGGSVLLLHTADVVEPMAGALGARPVQPVGGIDSYARDLAGGGQLVLLAFPEIDPVDVVGSLDAIEGQVDSVLPDLLDAWLPGSRLRPVLARPAGDRRSVASGIDLTVASDGLNLLVSVANTAPVDQLVELDVRLATSGLVAGWTAFDDRDVLAPQIQLRPGEAQLRYLRADVQDAGGTPLPQMFSPFQLQQAVDAAASRVDGWFAQGTPPGSAPAVILEQLDELLSAGNRPHKVLAGLLRLRRTPLLSHETLHPGSVGTLRAARLTADGTEPLSAAPVQVEYPLQSHARGTAGALVTGDGTPGCPLGEVAVVLDPDDPPTQDREVWDFVGQTYVVPSMGLVELHLADPTAGAQAAVSVVLE